MRSLYAMFQTDMWILKWVYIFFILTDKDMHKTSMEALPIAQLNTSLLHWISEQQYDRIRFDTWIFYLFIGHKWKAYE